MNPNISVIIPLYNKEYSIRRAINSVLSQTIQDFEIIVVNDGSIDNSVEIVKSIDDSRIVLISQPNKGVSTARNLGLTVAKGKYIVFLDADDVFSPKAFEIVDERIKAGVIIGDFVQTDEKGQVVRFLNNRISGFVTNNFQAYWQRKIFLRMGNMFIRSEVLKNVAGFRPDLSVYEDIEWIFRLLDRASVYVVKHDTVNYERGLSGLSRGLKSIDCDFAKIVCIKTISDKYKKYNVGDFIFRRFVIRLIKRDWKGVRVIWKNNSWRLIFCSFFCAVGYYRDRKYQF